MNFDLSDEQKAWKKSVHDFVGKVVKPKAREVDETYEFNWEAVRKGGPLGLLGMSIPEAVRERMRLAGSGAPARKEGVAIAREMLEQVKDRVAGAYIMPPFGKHDLALEVIDGIVR